MTNPILTRALPLSAMFIASTALTAQTAPKAAAPATTPHRSSTASHAPATAAPTCAKLPTISPKIPALPPEPPCAKPLYTITRVPETKLDYVSPMVSPELRESLGSAPATFSLYFIDTTIGTGEPAAPHKWYSVHYTGYLLDGTKFDSSLDRGEPISFPYGQHRVIQGWDTGFEGMHVGGKRRLYIPYQLAYGETLHGPIPAKSMLVFDLELVAQSDAQPAPKTPPTPPAQPTAAPAPKPAETTKPATPPPTQSTTPDSSAKPKS